MPPDSQPLLGQQNGRADQVRLVVQQMHSECGSCGYGRGGWAASPALKGKPILTPRSRVCPGCGEHFTHLDDPYAGALTGLPAGQDGGAS